MIHVSAVQQYVKDIRTMDKECSMALKRVLQGVEDGDDAWVREGQALVAQAVESTQAVKESFAKSIEIIQEASHTSVQSQIRLLRDFADAYGRQCESQMLLIGKQIEIVQKINETFELRANELEKKKKTLVEERKNAVEKEDRKVGEEEADLESKLNALEEKLRSTPTRVDQHFRQFYPLMLTPTHVVHFHMKQWEEAVNRVQQDKPFSLFN